MCAELIGAQDLQTFCPFKGTADYMALKIGDETIENAVWTYANALPESREIEGYVGFMPDVLTGIDLGDNVLRDKVDTRLASQ